MSFVKFVEYDGEVGLRIRSTAEGEASPLGGQQERRDWAQERPDEREHQSQRSAGRSAQEWKPEAPTENVSKNMTFPNDGTGVVKMEYSEDEISAVLGASEQKRKRLQKQGKVLETVAAYRLKELEHFQAREQLATWRKTHGYDRDDSWMHGARSLSPQEFTASLWSDLKDLRIAISMSGRARPWQKANELLDRLEGDLPDEKLSTIKRYVERQSREAAQVTVTPVSTVQHCITRSLTPGTPPDVRICMESNESKMDPEPTELELPSAGTGFETPGQ